MFEKVEIHRFRCFDSFLIDGLTRVNLIAGKNSVGKTAFLEGLFLLCGAQNISLSFTLSALRGLQGFQGDIESVLDLFWTPLFHNFVVNKPISISGELKNRRGQYSVQFELKAAESQRIPLNSPLAGETLSSRRLKLTYRGPSETEKEFEMGLTETGLQIKPVPAQPPFPAFFHSTRPPTANEDTGLFGNLIKAKQSYNLVEVLNKVDSRLKDLTTVQSAGGAMIYGDIGIDQLLPLSLMGDGMGRLLSILLRIANAPKGVVFIDEIENGIHYSILADVWKAIAEAARRFDTQLFIATHSYEAIKKANDVFQGSPDFTLHRLDRMNGKIEAVNYNSKELASALSSDFEVR